MPKKGKRQRQLAENASKAREASKKARLDRDTQSSQQSQPSTSQSSLTLEAASSSTSQPSLAPPTTLSSTDTTDEDFDPAKELADNPALKLEAFAEEWVLSLDREDKVSLSLFLHHNLKHFFNFTSTKSSEWVGMMLGKSDKTIRTWLKSFMELGEIEDSRQGRYQRRGLLWSNEDLNRKACQYVRENACTKGQPNMTAGSFCCWVNDCLLPSCCLEPGFPRKISVETARKWLHHLGFEILSANKGAYFNGHERDDVVEYRKEFLKEMIRCGFLHPDQAPTPEAQKAFPHDVPLASSDVQARTVVIFHDESTFHANEDQTTQWGVKGEGMLRPKSKGSRIMVSDFVDEVTGFLALTNDQFEEASEHDITVTKQARETLEIGESREGYWDSEKFMMQMNNAIKIAEIKYPKADGWHVVWVFDHSGCHTAMAKHRTKSYMF